MIREVKNGFKIVGVEGLEKAVFTKPVSLVPSKYKRIDGQSRSLSLQVLNLKNQSGAFSRIARLLGRVDAVLPSVQEAVTYQLESDGANKSSSRTPTRTMAVHFKEGEEWFVAFDDSTSDNPLIMDSCGLSRIDHFDIDSPPGPSWRYKSSGNFVLWLYDHHVLNFIFSHEDVGIKRLLERAHDCGRVVKLPKGSRLHWPYVTFRSNRDSSFARNNLVRAAMGEAAVAYSEEMASYQRKEIASALEDAIKENAFLSKRFRKSDKQLSREVNSEFSYCGGRRNIYYNGFKSLDSQLHLAEGFFAHPVIVKPVILFSASSGGGVCISGFDSAYFNTSNVEDDYSKSRCNGQGYGRPDDVVYGVINPCSWNPPEELPDVGRNESGKELGIDFDGRPWVKSRHPLDSDPLDL
jgi:hypothetical protein